MLNLAYFGKERKKKRKRGTGSAGGQNGLRPVLSFVATEKVCRNKVPGPCVATRFFVSRQGGVTAGTRAHDRSAVHVAACMIIMRASA